MKAVKKRNKYVVKSHMCEKAKKKVGKELKEQIKKSRVHLGKRRMEGNNPVQLDGHWNTKLLQNGYTRE